jgi:hypothetical protein
MMRSLSMAVLCAAALLSACGGDDKSEPTREGGPLNEPGTPGGDGATLRDCYTSPTTYLELINACTTAEKIAKNSVLPLLLVDGGLPPLP